MTNKPELQKFLQEKSSLFWWVKPEEKKNVSLNALVEAILNFGDERDVKRLFDLLGVKTVADIFRQQVSGPRSNYHPRTKNYFELYFKRHAQ